MPPPWSRSAGVWTGCRWRSSWPPPATKLLSPAALLARLDTALELRDTGVDRPSRQQTLRDTIAWSYELLDPSQQAFFRRLGVFAGGADLDAIAAVTADASDERRPDFDPFDLVADLVDASLATVTEGPEGEPRIGMLETIRLYALGELQRTGELDDRRSLHAHHYAQRGRPIAARCITRRRR